ncbi:MAG TPA: PepSY domain-containing protein [Nitrospiria bacterium]|nr:PepSY domain-containing protein [Nitrospiria bacterium]
MTTADQSPSRKPWFDYRAVWRWHFYAGLFCIPFVLFLAVTGSIYLFRPQIEPWLDRPYDHLVVTGHPASAEARVGAALAAVPGSVLHSYELPKSPNAATQIIVKRRAEDVRVYVHPETLQILKTVKEMDRLMNVIFYLHGELLLKNTGSTIVELAASWAIIMIVTGLYLWWPRQGRGLAGVVYPRFNGGTRLFWRDLHAVTGVWVSSLALFLLVTGLPWAFVWGSYLQKVRDLTHTAVAKPDWPVGHPEGEPGQVPPAAAGGTTAIPAEHAAHMARAGGKGEAARNPADYSPIDRLVGVVAPLSLAPPVLISPPDKDSPNWTARSEAQNRTLRVDLVLDGTTGAILKREDFKDRLLVDRLVGIGVAAHEGQLFGWPNQLLGVLTASGLILLSVSSVNMWWRRRPAGVLGAPDPIQNPRFSIGLGVLILIFAVYLPLFGLSMLVVKIIEKLILRRIPAVRDWLGLTMAAIRSG